MAGDVIAPPPVASRPGRARRAWVVLLVLGVASIAAGIGLVVGPLYGVFHRGQVDQTALNSWQSKLVGPNSVGGNADAHKSFSCGTSSPSDYALVDFNEPSQYDYAGVAGNGTWDLLDQRSMVHYAGTPGPGQPGNVIIAFHREPDYEYIDELGPGDTITIQDRACQTYVYKVTQRWILPPADITQLVPTSGYELTMITRDPWWQDYDRLVWRAELVSAPAPQSGSPTPGGGSVVNPSF